MFLINIINGIIVLLYAIVLINNYKSNKNN
jgi:hypothetical protein